MYKTTSIITALIIGLNASVSLANEEADQIRQDCENEVKTYGITDAEDYRQAVYDCVESMTPPVSDDQQQYDSMDDERG